MDNSFFSSHGGVEKKALTQEVRVPEREGGVAAKKELSAPVVPYLLLSSRRSRCRPMPYPVHYPARYAKPLPRIRRLGPGGLCSPCQHVQFNFKKQGSKVRLMTWRAA